MTEAQLRSLLQRGEGISVEFKENRQQLSREVYETVGAFLNRHGGDLLLGVNNNGNMVGVDPEKVNQIKQDFATAVNNPQKINPTFYLSLQEIEIDGFTILSTYIPESSMVHRCHGRIYDRNEDGDFDITDNTQLVAAMYQRKQATYSENRIFPYITMENLRSDLIDRARKMAGLQQEGHPWLEMDDLELVKSAQLYMRDYQTGEEGFTMASILLLGKDDVILSALPHHRTDAILRKKDPDRYDDRDDIRTNLIESYDRLMAFTQKHLPDPFYLEGNQRISLRDTIFREAIANMLIHREYINPYPAKLVIESGRVFCENSNRPHRHGYITPEAFSPFPKNPVIAKFFKQIGRADELGSGVRKLFRYCKNYGGRDPELIENDIFNIIIPIPDDASVATTQVSDQSTMHATMQVTMQATMQAEQKEKILKFCRTPKTRKEIQEYLGLKNRDYFRKEILNPLIDEGLLKPTIPDRPKSPNQRYIAVNPEKNK